MRVLHLVKTSDGAHWAAFQALGLARMGVEAHVALPSAHGHIASAWRTSGAILHFGDFRLPVHAPWTFPGVCARLRDLVGSIKPDLIHAHFVTNATLMRYALGRHHHIPRVFQVAGPLHLEHFASRRFELASAGSADYWIASSRCIRELYRRSCVPESRVFLSYYGTDTTRFLNRRTNKIRARLGIKDSDLVVGNINFIYPPKRYLGQRIGLKCHEDVIDALGIVLKERSDVMGVLAGGVWGGSGSYLKKLRRRAERVGRGRIVLPGYLPAADVADAWADFDCAVHVPLSENCGGVIEPLLAGVPMIAASVGGLPEVVVDGVTGSLVPPRDPEMLAAAILRCLSDRTRMNDSSAIGRDLVTEMFDYRRTSDEIRQIYDHILDPSRPRPSEFSSLEWLKQRTGQYSRLAPSLKTGSSL